MTSSSSDAVASEVNVVEYRQLSTAAVLSLVLGLASPLVLLGPVFAVAPLVALAVGFAALRSIAADPEIRSGRGLALWGVGLAAACLTMNAANGPMVRWLLTKQARPTAEAWLDAVRAGNLDLAKTVTVPAPPNPDAEGPPENSLVERFEAIGKLTGLDDWTGSSFRSTDQVVRRRRGRWMIDLSYTIDQPGQSSPLVTVVRLERWRTRSAGVAEWFVADISPPASETAR